MLAEFDDSIAVLDGGACEVGIESSIVDCSRDRAVLLRPGVLTRARIEAAAGEPLLEPDAEAPRAPGTLAAHYAPTRQSAPDVDPDAAPRLCKCLHRSRSAWRYIRAASR